MDSLADRGLQSIRSLQVVARLIGAANEHAPYSVYFLY